MLFLNVGLAFLVFCSACSGVLLKDSESEQEREKNVTSEESSLPKPKFWSGLVTGPFTDEAKKLPKYLTVPVSQDHREDLKPETGVRQIPRWLHKVLLGVPQTIPRAEEATQDSDLIGILCYLNGIYVRIRRDVFKSEVAYKYLTLGSCPVNQVSEDHYYLLYSLKRDCGFKVKSFPDYFTISISLHYKPTGPVLRDLPFNIPLQCKYHRLFYSYKVGFQPKLQGGTVFRKLQSNSSFTVFPQDASGKIIISRKIYNLGDLMHFEAHGHDKTESGEMRIYINKCFVTSSQNPNSHPRYTVIGNQGCMIDSKVTMQSRFLPSDSEMIQKFSVGAFVFKEDVSTTSPQQFYMHCEMSEGPPTPTPSFKACSFDHATHKWKELYGRDCVCKCCESTCPSAEPQAKSERTVSSHSWKVGSSDGEEDAHLMKPADTEPVISDMKKQTDFLGCE